MSYNEAAEERKFRPQTLAERRAYHWQDERSAAFERARPEVADKPAEPQPEDLPAEKRR